MEISHTLSGPEISNKKIRVILRRFVERTAPDGVTKKYESEDTGTRNHYTHSLNTYNLHLQGL